MLLSVIDVLFWEKKPVKEGKKKGCVKKNWKGILVFSAAGIVILGAIAIIVIDFFINWNASLTVIAMSTCLSSKPITKYSTEIEIKRDNCVLRPYHLDFSAFKYLKRFSVKRNGGNTVELIGLKHLETIEMYGFKGPYSLTVKSVIGYTE